MTAPPDTCLLSAAHNVLIPRRDGGFAYNTSEVPSTLNTAGLGSLQCDTPRDVGDDSYPSHVPITSPRYDSCHDDVCVSFKLRHLSIVASDHLLPRHRRFRSGSSTQE